MLQLRLKILLCGLAHVDINGTQPAQEFNCITEGRSCFYYRCEAQCAGAARGAQVGYQRYYNDSLILLTYKAWNAIQDFLNTQKNCT